jgi:TRAP-type C4-dicarboxylate transport system permease small subunit
MIIFSIVDFLNRVTRYVLISIVVVMSFILLLQIVSRFLVFFPLPWSQELLQYMNIWMVFLGAGMAVREGGHIRVELLRERLPEKAKPLFNTFSNVLSLALVSLVALQAYTLMGKTAAQSFGSFPLPMSWFYLSLLLGCSLMALNYALVIFRDLSALSGKEGNS